MKDKPVILVVDDQPQNIELLEAQLVPQGYEIVKAANGEEALGKLSGNQIDLILLDVIMPGMDGFEVTRRVRQDDKIRQLPIILITVLWETEDRVKGIDAGCDDFISKPVDKMELLARVRSLLKVKAYNDLMINYRKELESGITRRTDELKHALENLQQDIAERKQAEEALRQSEARYRILFEQAADIILQMEITPEGMPVIRDANNATLRLLGYERDELIGKPVSFLEATPDASKVVNERRHNVLSGTGTVFEARHRCKDGTIREFECSATEMQVGPKTFAISVERDITERKWAEWQLKERTKELRTLYGLSEINEKKSLTLDEVYQECADLLPKGWAYLEVACARIVIENREFRTANFMETAWKQSSPVKVGGSVAGQIDVCYLEKRPEHDEGPFLKEERLLIDSITERLGHIIEGRRAEGALRESEEKYRGIFENVQDVYYEAALDGTIIEVSPSIEIISKGQYHRNDLIGKSMYDFYAEVGERQALLKALQERGSVADFEVTLKNRDGSSILCSISSKVMSNAQGNPEKIIGSMRDITERVQAEAALRESEEKYRSLVDGASEAIIVAQNGMLAFVNRKTTELLGHSGPDLMGKPFSEYIYPDDRTMVVDNYAKRMKGESVPPRYEFRVLSVDGSAKWVEINAVLIDWKGKPATLNFLTDITERKQHETEKEHLLAQLLQAQKMEAIGTLAGGVAHDFNNLLTAISGYTTMAMEKIDEADPVQRDLKQVSIAAIKAAGVTRQLLLFSRKQHMEPMPMDPNVTISHLLKMLDRLIGEDIVIETDLEKDVWSILGDEGNIEQILMNLSVNARDAMPSGGKLFIKTENVTLDQEYCRTRKMARPGRFVCLSISDTGTGMDELTQEHIFEPFFTTKEAGKGTGLGLSVVFGIVQQHKGWINVYSEPGHGTTIKVYFPASFARPEQQSKKEVPLASLQGKGERIMVVEDQAEVRELAVEILKTTGYSVFPVSSAKEAMELFEKENGRFDLVFSDVVLTDMTGILLVEELQKRWKLKNPAASCEGSSIPMERKHTYSRSLTPEQAPGNSLAVGFRVLITSGYTDEKAHWDFIKENNYRFLHKPYAKHDLLQAVKEVLAEKKS
jgi:PAS domain S-box-containing protein